MSWKTAPLADNYNDLARQFRALRTFAVCQEARLNHYENVRHMEHLAQAQIEGERAANAMLTEEVERLNALLDARRA